MYKKLLILIPFALSFGALQADAYTAALSSLSSSKQEAIKKEVLAEHAISLSDRYKVPSVNSVFRDNISLNLAYLSGTVKTPSDINWDTLHKPQSYEFVLQPGEVFAYHDDIAPEFQGKTVKIQNSHFSAADGYRSSGLLYGDGVCHFASLINWVATDAGLKVVAPVRHDFAVIPGIDRIYGTSIYSGDQRQNLYIENTSDKQVKFVFMYENDTLTLRIEK